MEEKNSNQNDQLNEKHPTFARKTRVKHSSFENSNNIEKLSLNFVIVNEGVGGAIVSLLRSYGASMSFVNVAKGTASKEILSVLGITNTSKELVCSFVKTSSLKEIEKELAAFFLANKKNQGISFSVPLSSIEGVRLYKFLTQTL